MGHHHVAKRAGRLVEAGASAEPQRLGHVDLHVVDEVSVPDRLEQAVGEAEGQDVLRRFLAEEVVDPEDLVLGEDLCSLRVQRYRAGEIGAEGLLHDDAASLDKTGLGQQPHRRQGGAGRHAQIVHATALAAQRLLRRLDRRLERAGAGRQRHVVQGLRRRRPSRPRSPCGVENCSSASRASLRKPSASSSSSETPMIRQPGMKPAAAQMEQARQQLPPRQVTGGAHQDDDLRISRADL